MLPLTLFVIRWAFETSPAEFHSGSTIDHKKRAAALTCTELQLPIARYQFYIVLANSIVSAQIERKLTKLKDLGIAKGKWPGRAGPHEPEIEEKEFKDYRQEVRAIRVALRGVWDVLLLSRIEFW